MKKNKGLLVLIIILFVSVIAAVIFKHRDFEVAEESTQGTEETVSQNGKETQDTEETDGINEAASRQVEAFVENIGNSGADTMLLSMFPVETYNKEILYTYMLAQTEILDVPLDSGKQLVEVLETVLEQPNALTKVLLGIHSESIKEDETKGLALSCQSDLLQEGLAWEAAILELGKSYPEVTFEIVLYYPKISYLTAMDQEQAEGMMDWYAYAAELYCHYDAVPNVHVFMPGSEEWLICNESNYQDAYNLTDEVANEIEKLIFCDYAFRIYPENIEEKCNQLSELVNAYREKSLTQGQQEDYTYVFLGDSVIGNYTGSLSIPGAVSDMTGAQTINCGFGGLSATKASESAAGLKNIVDTLLAKEPGRDAAVIANEITRNGILEFWEAELPEDTDKLVFFLSFGINDYMTGHPVYNAAMDEACYKGALAGAVDALEAAYPNAEIILMTPNFIAIGNFGTDVNGEKGAPYADYIEAVLDLGTERNLQVIDIYHELGVKEDNFEKYLGDMCHPSYYGRFKIGEIIRNHMSGLQS